MGIAYRCDTRHGITIAVWDGVVTFDELRDVVCRQLADADWPAGRLALTDARTALGMSAITDDQISEIAAMYGAHQAKVAYVKYARVGKGTQGLLTFQKAMRPPTPTTLVFDDLETACEWLGISIEDVAPTIEELRREIRSR